MMLFKIWGFVYYTIHCSLARNSLAIWSNVTEDQFLNYVLASCLIFKKKKKEKKCLIVLCQMIATWSPNLLFWFPCRLWTLVPPCPWVLVLGVGGGTCSFWFRASPPRRWPLSHPGPPSGSCFSELHLKNTTVSPYPLLNLQTRYFCCNFFQCLSPKGELPS